MNEPQTKEEFDADPRYNGQPEPECPECHRHASPRGRSAPMDMLGCECSPGPERGSLWTNETREQFGYPAELAAESKRLRAIFYPPTLDAEQLAELQQDIVDADANDLTYYDDEAISIAVIELLRLRTQVTNLKAQVAAWQRHDNDTAGPYCPQPHRMISDDR